MEARESAMLLDRAGQGDVEAFAELFEGLRPKVFAIAWRLAGPNDAEDIVMDTYLKAWKALPGFNRRSSLETWLYRIAHNCAVDVLRSRRSDREPEGGHVEAADLPDNRLPAPDQAAAAHELGGIIRRALDQLSPEHRAAVTLRFTDGLSYAEIAAATGVSLGTVMSRLFNGRRRLQRLLRERKEIFDETT
jgi:RNA polymerase sigma-70 factor, ECF subfamily